MAAVAVVGAMVVEVALVIALLIGVCLGFWLRKAWSTTTRASKETAAINGPHCERGNDDDTDNGTYTDKEKEVRHKGTGRDTDTDSDGSRSAFYKEGATTRQGLVWVNNGGRVYHTSELCRHVCRSSNLVDVSSLPSPPWRVCLVCVGYVGHPCSPGPRARRAPRVCADEASDDARRTAVARLSGSKARLDTASTAAR